MANREHLNMLQQDVEFWNQWRQQHTAAVIDLSEADLHGATLRRANLSKANLSNANLSGADLYGVNLCQADLCKTIVSRAVLSRADLREADLREAECNGTNFYLAALCGTNLSRTVLSRAVLSGADLSGADLRGAILYRASLIGTNLSNVKFTGTYLFGTLRDDWIIEGIACEYVFWDPKGKKRTPPDRPFQPGEFEARYKSLPTFEYHLVQDVTPLDLLLLNQIVQVIAAAHPEYQLRIHSLHSREQPQAVFTVAQKDYIEDALQQISAYYERRMAALEGKQAQLSKMLTMLTANPWSPEDEVELKQIEQRLEEFAKAGAHT